MVNGSAVEKVGRTFQNQYQYNPKGTTSNDAPTINKVETKKRKRYCKSLRKSTK
jgi:hypothetical protein